MDDAEWEKAEMKLVDNIDLKNWNKGGIKNTKVVEERRLP